SGSLVPAYPPSRRRAGRIPRSVDEAAALRSSVSPAARRLAKACSSASASASRRESACAPRRPASAGTMRRVSVRKSRMSKRFRWRAPLSLYNYIGVHTARQAWDLSSKLRITALRKGEGYREIGLTGVPAVARRMVKALGIAAAIAELAGIVAAAGLALPGRA